MGSLGQAGPSDLDVDCLIIGGGFSGISALYRTRKLGLKAVILESGSDFGGVWYHNRYPGARVDSEWPYYQLNIPEVYTSWSFSERFPGHKELRSYMEHLDNVLDLRKDTLFNAHVIDCSWNATEARWHVKTKTGTEASGKYLLICTGLLHRRHYPSFPGLDTFKGEIHHSGFWNESLSTKGKKVALIGAGATAVQITQEVGKDASQLTIFMRRPSYCLPMGQRPMSELENRGFQLYYDTLLSAGRKSYAGFPSRPAQKASAEYTPEQREEIMSTLWSRGGFQFMNSFNDTIINAETNKIVYEFWSRKVRQRMRPGKKRDLMAPEPEKMPYHFGTKRAPLEQDYYEVVDQDSVDVVNMNEKRIKTFTDVGLVYEDGETLEFDMLILATGFDSFSGSITNMGFKNENGIDIKDVWASEGIQSYLGMTIAGFPNAFMIYSPHAPTALSNGPTIIEAQADMIITNLIASMEKQHIRSINPQPAAQQEWVDAIDNMSKHTLLPLTNSWWNASNVPGKKVQMLTYIGGINTYEPTCQGRLAELKGFDVEYVDGDGEGGVGSGKQQVQVAEVGA